MANFRFYGQLNDFLQPVRRLIWFDYAVTDRPAIKDTIEALGVPHTEVHLILVNGEPVDFAYHIENSDRVSLYPVSTNPNVLPGEPEERFTPRFILDVHLGRLTAYLRMMGFDTLYRNDYDDPELAHISSAEGRILLTRDRGLLKRSEVRQGYYVRQTDPARQIVEIVRRFRLTGVKDTFPRCLQCNAALETVAKELILDRLPPRTLQYYDEFRICRACDKIYWKGSHYERMRHVIEQALDQEFSEDDVFPG